MEDVYPSCKTRPLRKTLKAEVLETVVFIFTSKQYIIVAIKYTNTHTHSHYAKLAKGERIHYTCFTSSLATTMY